MQGVDAYVPLTEAAQRLGVSVDTVRRRIRAGELVAQREQRPQGYRWLVKLPEPPSVVEVLTAPMLHADVQVQGASPELLEQLMAALERVADRLTDGAPPAIPDYVPTLQLIRAESAPDTQQPGHAPMYHSPPSPRSFPWWRRLWLALLSAS